MFQLESYRVVKLGAGEQQALQALHERCHSFLELVYGEPPRPDAAAHLLNLLPEGGRWTLEDKFVFGLYEGDTLVGVIDAIRGFPEPGGWALGLLMLDTAHRGAGLGARFHAAFEQWVRAQGGTALCLIVQEQNPRALRFWQRQGYSIYGQGQQHAAARENLVYWLRKPLA